MAEAIVDSVDGECSGADLNQDTGIKSSYSGSNNSWKRIKNNFANSKNQCLGKRDKSSAGRLDAGAVEICAVLNELDCYYTTSSCAGRCFLYTGEGIKSTDTFFRCRVSHSRLADANRYFDLTTLDADPTGGGDAIIHEYDGGRRQRQREKNSSSTNNSNRDEPNDHAIAEEVGNDFDAPPTDDDCCNSGDDKVDSVVESASDICSNLQSTARCWWLRYEPFILHVACRSLSAASALMNTARPTFKNVGLTTITESKFLVAIWGDEGLDMPITTADGISMVTLLSSLDTTTIPGFAASWLADLVNERHDRNASKIARFVQAVRDMSPVQEDDDVMDATTAMLYPPFLVEDDDPDGNASNSTVKLPRSYDVIGDVAMIHSLPTNDPDEQKAIGEAILSKNKAIKIVALRQSNLAGTERAPGVSGIQILAGTATRNPLITTHREYGIACIVDLHHTFFSPRMGPERLRLCQQTARGEHVLVLFAGVCMDALQMAARTEAATVTAIEWNDIAVDCAHKAHKLLERNKQGIKCEGAAERLQIIHGDCLQVLPTLPRNHYHRILAPRPKEGDVDGDQPPPQDTDDQDTESATLTTATASSGGADFLATMLPVLKQNGGECHWYDFCADHEYPRCERTRSFLAGICRERGLAMQVLHVAHVGSVAKRQLRICLDFRVYPADA